jgi:hypothetical protein
MLDAANVKDVSVFAGCTEWHHSYGGCRELVLLYESQVCGELRFHFRVVLAFLYAASLELRFTMVIPVSMGNLES